MIIIRGQLNVLSLISIPQFELEILRPATTQRHLPLKGGSLLAINGILIYVIEEFVDPFLTILILDIFVIYTYHRVYAICHLPFDGLHLPL